MDLRNDEFNEIAPIVVKNRDYIFQHKDCNYNRQ